MIVSKRLSVVTALVLIPIIFGLISGTAPKELFEMMLAGIKQVAPTGILLMFAVLYFAVMLDVGLFDPVIGFILRYVKGDPLKVALGTAILTMIVHLDGDDVFSVITGDEISMETGKPLKSSGTLLSANAYMGVDGILEALLHKPDIIITGRVADPSLFLAPMIYEFGWPRDNYGLLGQGTIVGHLLECAGQITGGYYADPVLKPISEMATLGHPYADVWADGTAQISKVSGTGGVVTLATAKEQLLYEVVDPHSYYTPDVIADFTSVRLEQIDEDVVKVIGGLGRMRPDTLKVSVGYQAMYLGEGEITYAGVNAVQRARLAGDIVNKRLGHLFPSLRIDLIGHSSVHGDAIAGDHKPYEVRLRVAGKSERADLAGVIGEEVEALYTNGPAGGGGVRKYVHEVVGIVSITMDRRNIKHHIKLFSS